MSCPSYATENVAPCLRKSKSLRHSITGVVLIQQQRSLTFTYTNNKSHLMVWVTCSESRALSHVAWVTCSESRALSHVLWVTCFSLFSARRVIILGACTGSVIVPVLWIVIPRGSRLGNVELFVWCSTAVPKDSKNLWNLPSWISRLLMETVVFRPRTL